MASNSLASKARSVSVRALPAAAKELPADLVVMSTHGRTGLKHVFLGSVTDHVVRQAPCPVLIVRDREHEFG